MADFGFTEAHEILRNEIRSFARRELAPGAKKRAKLNHIPKDIAKKVAGLGLTGMNLPAEFGGQQADWVSLGVATEELAKVDMAASILPMCSIVPCLMLMDGPAKLQKELIPQIISYDKIVCFGLTEPGCGSDALAIQTKAVRDGDYYIINGEKTSITRATQASAILVIAKTDPKAGAKGITCFYVPYDTPGVSTSRFEDTGWKPFERGSVFFENVRVPVEYRIGDEGRAFYNTMNKFDWTRSMLGLQALGAAQASLDEAIAYAKERVAFGQPIAKFEGVSFKLSHDLTLITAARLLAYKALWLRDHGLPHTKEAAMVKYWCPEVALRVIHDCLLTHGHNGFSEELPFEQRLRDVIGHEMGDGSAEVQKTIITREIFGKEFVAYA